MPLADPNVVLPWIEAFQRLSVAAAAIIIAMGIIFVTLKAVHWHDNKRLDIRERECKLRLKERQAKIDD